MLLLQLVVVTPQGAGLLLQCLVSVFRPFTFELFTPLLVLNQLRFDELHRPTALHRDVVFDLFALESDLGGVVDHVCVGSHQDHLRLWHSVLDARQPEVDLAVICGGTKLGEIERQHVKCSVRQEDVMSDVVLLLASKIVPAKEKVQPQVTLANVLTVREPKLTERTPAAGQPRDEHSVRW